MNDDCPAGQLAQIAFQARVARLIVGGFLGPNAIDRLQQRPTGFSAMRNDGGAGFATPDDSEIDAVANGMRTGVSAVAIGRAAGR